MHGSLLAVSIEGISFVPVADIDVSIVLNQWDNELEPNGSGPASTKSVRKVPSASNIMLRADAVEHGYLRDWSDDATIVEFYMTLRDGSVYGCRGLLKVDEVSTAAGTVSISIYCKTKWDISAA